MKKLMLITALSLTVPFAYAEQPATSMPGAASSAPGAESAAFSQIDTDQDGIDDGAEVTLWLNLGSSWDADIDQDGLVNLLDTDADDDGMADGEEVAAGYDPSDPTDPTRP